MHLYNSTSATQRRVVFRLGEDGIIDLAVRGAELCKELAGSHGHAGRVRVLARELPRHRARARARDLRGGDRRLGARRREERMIVNLPTTVEAFPPNVYADRHRVVPAARLGARRDRPQRAPAQRPRHRGRDRRARPDGGRRPRRGDAVRERRAHRQRRPDHARAQPAHAGRRSADSTCRSSTRRGGSSRSATSCPSTRATRRSASSSTRRSRARTRTRSRRACTRSSARSPRSGTCRTCRSTRRTSAAATRRSSASTRSRARAASPT